jgi:ribosome-associated protein
MKSDSEKLYLKIVELLDEKKAHDIKVIDIADVSSLADYFVICTGNSTTQIKALADHVEEKLAEIGYIPSHKEGYSTASWILVDYGFVVIHIFHNESRQFYDLERLWPNARQLDLKLT